MPLCTAVAYGFYRIFECPFLARRKGPAKAPLHEGEIELNPPRIGSG